MAGAKTWCVLLAALCVGVALVTLPGLQSAAPPTAIVLQPESTSSGSRTPQGEDEAHAADEPAPEPASASSPLQKRSLLSERELAALLSAAADVPIDPADGKPTTMTVEQMRATCEALPWYATASWRNVTVTNATDQPTFIEPSLSCVAGGRLYRDNPAPREERYYDPFVKIKFEHLTDAVLARAAPTAANNFSSPGVVFHRRLGLIVHGKRNTESIAHLYFENLRGAADAMVAFNGGELLRAPRRAMHLANTFTMFKFRKSHCKPCMGFTSMLESPPFEIDDPHAPGGSPELRRNPRTPAVHMSTDKPEGVGLQCFCGAMLVGTSKPVDARRQAAAFAVQSLANHRFGGPPYRRRATFSEFARFGLWENRSLEHAPRLLLLNRKTSRQIGNWTLLADAARLLGFNVAVVWFEDMTAAAQFHAGRFADVFMGIHGMGLTQAAWMERGCRSIIELTHWAGPAMHEYFRRLEFANITREFVVATRVKFGPSVRNPNREKRDLPHCWSKCWDFRGFDDQTTWHPRERVIERLMSAKERLSRCPY